jgi:hypothetical protein
VIPDIPRMIFKARVRVEHVMALPRPLPVVQKPSRESKQ